MRRLSVALIGLALVVACVPHGRVTPTPMSDRAFTLTVCLTDQDGAPLAGETRRDGIQPTTWTPVPATCQPFPHLLRANFNVTARADGYSTEVVPVSEAVDQTVTVRLTRTAPVYTIPTGQVHAIGRSFADDRGEFLDLGATLFPTQWLYLHDRARLDANLAFLAKYRADPRILLVVSNENTWHERYVDPQSPDWNTAFVETVKLAHDKYGLRPFVTVFGDPYLTREARAEIVQRVANLTRDNGLAPKILGFECSNEAQIRDIGELEACARVLLTVHPLVALSSAEDFDGGPERVYAGGVATLFQMHPERDTLGGSEMFRPSRKPYEYRFFGGLPTIGGAGEPRGRASSITSVDHLPIDEATTLIAADAMMTWLSGWGQYVVHESSGIYMLDYQYSLGHRYANLFDSPMGVAIFETVAKLRDFLPANLANWTGLVHADPSKNGQFAFATLPGQSFDGQFQACGMRAYTAYYGAHGLTVTLGQCSDMELIGRSDTATDVKVFAIDGTPIESFTLAPNERHVLKRYASAVILETWFK